MENIKCLICNKENFKIILNKIYPSTFHDVVICKECGLVYLNHRKTEGEYNAYYQDDYLAEFKRYFSNTNGVKEWRDCQAFSR